jgi:CRP-like cAMP-binding protein
MGLEQDIELLARVALFQDFGIEQLRLIAFGTEREQLKTGTLLFSSGDESDGGYVVANGQVDIVVYRDEHEFILERCYEASLIGEMALITGNRRATAAIARQNSDLLFIPRSLFHRLLREYPDIAALLHGRIARSIRTMVHQMEKIHERLSDIPSLGSNTAIREKSQK